LPKKALDLRGGFLNGILLRDIMFTPDKISDQTLEQLIANDEEGIKDFDTIKALVSASLFSVFAERRRYALGILKQNWVGFDIDIKTTEEKGIISSYLSFNGEDGTYFLVGSYDSDRPTVEKPPTASEMEDWNNY